MRRDTDQGPTLGSCLVTWCVVYFIVSALVGTISVDVRVESAAPSPRADIAPERS